jgi:hypothetical protein
LKSQLYRLNNDIQQQKSHYESVISDKDKSTQQFVDNSNFVIIYIIYLISILFMIFLNFKIEIWKIVAEKRSVWHMDATGGIHKKIAGQKKPFFYSIVCYDSMNKQIIPVAEFLTTSQTGQNIGSYLTKIKNIYDHANVELPRIIVTDFCWAEINAILLTFNYCDPLTYLVRSYDFIVNGVTNQASKVIVALCSTHFIKSIAIKSSKVFKTKILLYKQDTKNSKKDANIYESKQKEVRRVFMFIFSLLINSTTLYEFEYVLLKMWTIFRSVQFGNSVEFAIKEMELSVKNKNLNSIDIDESLSTDESEKIVNLQSFIAEDFTEESLIQDSPFTHHFNILIKKMETAILINDSIQCIQSNSYKDDNFIEIIKEYLHIMPFWSGVLIAKDEETKDNINIKCSISNNYVEIWFCQLKKNILRTLNLNKATVSQIANLIIKHINRSTINITKKLHRKLEI